MKKIHFGKKLKKSIDKIIKKDIINGEDLWMKA